ncbi:hypothetical protein [Streptomyces sp. NPDC019890]|uniref:hypothetical protein n=1 Tax=Streptomyces sp. NPDC019890 TaxID=3365064 RepID=UPI00384AE961
MIKPEDIPRFTGNLEVLEKAVAALDADGSGFTSTGSDIHNRFQSLASYYEAPEAEKLFATTAAVQTTGENLGSDVESVARALGEYANEIRPLVARLEQLRSEAIAFVAEAKRGHVLINNWQRDQDKVDKNEELVNGVTATTTAFWEAERTAANKIMALFSCIKYRANDGSNKPDMYGFSADALKDAELPWGSVEERTFLPGNIDRHIKSFVWDGLIVDNIWGTIQGLGALVGIGADASDTWAALGRVFIGAGDFLQDPLNDRPGGLGDTPFGQQSRNDAKEFAKGLVAWDMWSENPARASATVVFNVLTLGVGPLKAGTAAKAGLGAKAAGTAAKIGELLDPVSATVKAAGAAAPKIAEITAGLRKAVPDLPDLGDGSVRLTDGSILRTVDGELVITKPDGSVAERAAAELSAADRAALDDAARARERPPASVGAVHAPGGTAHAGDGLPAQASRGPSDRVDHDAPVGSGRGGADEAGGRGGPTVRGGAHSGDGQAPAGGGGSGGNSLAEGADRGSSHGSAGEPDASENGAAQSGSDDGDSPAAGIDEADEANQGAPQGEPDWSRPALPPGQAQLSLAEVRALRDKRTRWSTAEVFFREMYGGGPERHYPVPTSQHPLYPVEAAGGRKVDSPVDLPDGRTLAMEIKTYQEYRTIKLEDGGNQTTKVEVPLSKHIREQIHKDLALREMDPGFDPRWIFTHAPPSLELRKYLIQARIIFVEYGPTPKKTP